MSRLTHMSRMGFSLIELLVVLTLIGMMASIVPSFFSNGVSGTEFKGAARSLSASLRSARMHAISRHQDVSVSFNLEDNSYQISGSDKRYVFPKGIEVEVSRKAMGELNNEQAIIQFYADGGATGGLISLLKGDNARYDIAVDWLTGQVKILP